MLTFQFAVRVFVCVCVCVRVCVCSAEVQLTEAAVTEAAKWVQQMMDGVTSLSLSSDTSSPTPTATPSFAPVSVAHSANTPTPQLVLMLFGGDEQPTEHPRASSLLRDTLSTCGAVDARLFPGHSPDTLVKGQSTSSSTNTSTDALTDASVNHEDDAPTLGLWLSSAAQLHTKLWGGRVGQPGGVGSRVGGGAAATPTPTPSPTAGAAPAGVVGCIDMPSASAGRAPSSDCVALPTWARPLREAVDSMGGRNTGRGAGSATDGEAGCDTSRLADASGVRLAVKELSRVVALQALLVRGIAGASHELHLRTRSLRSILNLLDEVCVCVRERERDGAHDGCLDRVV